ncbi:hypothetical protein C8P63_10631 [Melghirimyces profundicolus]|uniref:Uncharacterized protein n=1 Tax=Melghirimyces profundicolus TaxID=1242148 RepID=A0A2T6C0D5_9BACL|nr:hypothetical protein [Melghirimyces profundicolus]PTX61779.1 hypothetical protein C8P63_10631 [Melghirimyces profundicolus]
MRYKRRCMMVTAYAPTDLKLKEANALFNQYIANRERGHCVFHDHFLHQPGGVAFFEVSREEQEKKVKNAAELPGWRLEIQPLIHSRSAAGFVAQLHYTSENYFDIPLSSLTERIDRAKMENRSPFQA